MSSTASLATAKAIKAELIIRHDTNGLSWLKLAQIYNIPCGTLWDIAHGKPIPLKWYTALGLPEHQPAPVCRYCGRVHIRKCWKQYRRWRDMPAYMIREAFENRIII